MWWERSAAARGFATATDRIEEGEVLVQDGTLGNPENAFSETDSVQVESWRNLKFEILVQVLCGWNPEESWEVKFWFRLCAAGILGNPEKLKFGSGRKLSF